MNKKLLAGLIGYMLAFSLVGCGETVNVNVENNEKLNSNTLGTDSLVYIGDCLYYDSTTRIVYWWNGYLSPFVQSTTPSAYLRTKRIAL